MKAAMIEALGDAPRLVTVEDPSRATDGQIVIKIEAAALNAIDLHLAAGHHRAGPPQLPYAPGIESVGTVLDGPNEGTRVRATALAGLLPGANGGLAELQLVEGALCVPVPHGLDSVTAAAIGVVGSSADLGLAKATFRPGDSVLVSGATGPFGHAFLQLARIAGAARVIAVGRDRHRLEALTSVDGVIAFDGIPVPEQLESVGGPVDLVVDSVWGNWAETLLRCLKPGGRYLNVGAAGGDGAPFHVEGLRASQLALIGFSAASASPPDILASYRRVAQLAASDVFMLPTEVYPLDKAAEAWQAQASSPGKKIVLVP